MQFEYKTREVSLRGGEYGIARALNGASNPREEWEIFWLEPLGLDRYRLFMKREKHSR